MKLNRTVASTLLAATAFIALAPQTISFANENGGNITLNGGVLNPASARYAYVIATEFSMTPSDSGATYSLIIDGINSVTEISGWVTLSKRDSSGVYKEVDSEYVEEFSNRLFLDSSLSTDGPGSYRITFKGRVYTDNGSESLSLSKNSSY